MYFILFRLPEVALRVLEEEPVPVHVLGEARISPPDRGLARRAGEEGARGGVQLGSGLCHRQGCSGKK